MDALSTSTKPVEVTIRAHDYSVIFQYPEQGRVAEMNVHRSVRDFLDLLVPGHFGVALSDKEKEVMLRIAAEQASQVTAHPVLRVQTSYQAL